MRPAPHLLLLCSAALGGEWDVERPADAPEGEPVALRVTLERGTAHGARVRTLQRYAWEQRKHEVQLDFEAALRLDREDEHGRLYLAGPLGITRIVIDDEDLTERVNEASPDMELTGQVAEGIVRGGNAHGTDGLGSLGMFLAGAPSWILPHLPAGEVRRGEVWDVPPAYLAWSLRQAGRKPPTGAAFQTLEAMEEREGVRCARLRTAFSLVREEPELSPGFQLGEGAGTARIRGEAVEWLGLDGYLRASTWKVRMRIENAGTGAALEWTLEREVEAGPAALARRTGADWSKHMGDLAFVVGSEEGRAEARFTGRPPMYFFTALRSRAGAEFGARVFQDPKVLEAVAGFTPVLVDVTREREVAEKHLVLVEPAVVWLDHDGEQVMMAQGASPTEMFLLTAEAAHGRVDEPRPTPEYTALLGKRDALRAALAAGENGKAEALIAEIRAVGRGAAVQREADAAEARLRAK